MEDESKIDWKKLYFELLTKVATLEAEIKEPRENLNTNSSNSFKPAYSGLVSKVPHQAISLELLMLIKMARAGETVRGSPLLPPSGTDTNYIFP